MDDYVARLVVMTTMAGYWMACDHLDPTLLAATCLGTGVMTRLINCAVD